MVNARYPATAGTSLTHAPIGPRNGKKPVNSGSTLQSTRVPAISSTVASRFLNLKILYPADVMKNAVVE
jgi:hypothetical protein